MARNRIWEFIKKVGRDIDDQVWKRAGPHGSAELGAALFGQSNAYVMYGQSGPPGDARPAQDAQAQPKTEQADRAGSDPEQQQAQERGGRSR